MVLHGLGHELTKMALGPRVRDPTYDMMHHFEFAVGNIHSQKTKSSIFELSKIVTDIMVVPEFRI